MRCVVGMSSVRVLPKSKKAKWRSRQEPPSSEDAPVSTSSFVLDPTAFPALSVSSDSISKPGTGLDPADGETNRPTAISHGGAEDSQANALVETKLGMGNSAETVPQYGDYLESPDDAVSTSTFVEKDHRRHSGRPGDQVFRRKVSSTRPESSIRRLCLCLIRCTTGMSSIADCHCEGGGVYLVTSTRERAYSRQVV